MEPAGHDDFAAVFKLIWNRARAPEALATQERATVEAVSHSYRPSRATVQLIGNSRRPIPPLAVGW